MTVHILLIEPESKLAKLIALELKQAGYQVTELLSELPDLTRLPQRSFSLVIFDLKRLKFSGLEIQRQVQAIAEQMPVIELSTMDQDEAYQNFNQFDSEIKDHLFLKKPTKCVFRYIMAARQFQQMYCPSSLNLLSPQNRTVVGVSDREAHGGELRLESSAAAGTTITVQMPRALQ